MVHFTVPVSSATIAALAEVAQGAVTASMGSGLFAVSCRSEVLNRVRRFPGVASLRVRTPADKRAALALPVDQQATYSRNLSPLDNGPVHVRCPCTWPSQSCASRISSVFEAHLCAATSSRAPHHKVAGVYPAVAALVEVDCVEELLPFASLDFATKQILWNASNDIMDSSHVSSLNGSGQVIAIADTGLGTSSCFFNYGQTITSDNTNTRIDAGNVHTYWTMRDCQQCGNCPGACSNLVDLEGHGIAAGRANTHLPGGLAASSEKGLRTAQACFFRTSARRRAPSRRRCTCSSCSPRRTLPAPACTPTPGAATATSPPTATRALFPPSKLIPICSSTLIFWWCLRRATPGLRTAAWPALSALQQHARIAYRSAPPTSAW